LAPCRAVETELQQTTLKRAGQGCWKAQFGRQAFHSRPPTPHCCAKKNPASPMRGSMISC